MSLIGLASICLEAAEIISLTGRTRKSKQIEALNSMGIPFKIRPNGSIAILRSVAEKELGGKPARTKQVDHEPDFDALAKLMGRKSAA